MAIETVAVLGALVGTIASLVPQLSSLSSKLFHRWSKIEPKPEKGKSFVLTIKEPSGKTVKVHTIEDLSLDKIVSDIQTMALRQSKKKQRQTRTPKRA